MADYNTCWRCGRALVLLRLFWGAGRAGVMLLLPGEPRLCSLPKLMPGGRLSPE